MERWIALFYPPKAHTCRWLSNGKYVVKQKPFFLFLFKSLGLASKKLRAFSSSLGNLLAISCWLKFIVGFRYHMLHFYPFNNWKGVLNKLWIFTHDAGSHFCWCLGHFKHRIWFLQNSVCGQCHLWIHWFTS